MDFHIKSPICLLNFITENVVEYILEALKLRVKAAE